MFLVADGNNMAWAGFHALRKPMGAETPEAKTRAALLGLTQSALGFAVRAGEPPTPGPAREPTTRVTRLAIAFDHGRPLRRRGIYPAYQTGREANPSFMDNEEYVLAAIDQFIELAARLPIEIARGENTEADDLAAVLVIESEDPVRIGSTDRDFLQLVDERVSIYSPVKRLVIDADNFVEAAAPRASDGTPVAFPRERYLEYRVASGDASDDLPGIPGVGALTAARLLAVAPLDAYFDQPSLAATALGRRNAKLEAALRDDATLEIVARNRLLMDLRLAAKRYDNIGDLVTVGQWDEGEFRAWTKDQRIAGLDIEAAVRAMARIAEGGS
jgi:5'-3' exonuclease